MGCRVEQVLLENGESSKLFEALHSTMESGEALETYLELSSNKEAYIKMYGKNEQGEVSQENYISSPKYKLEGFKDRREQDDIMDFLVDEIVEAFSTIQGTQSMYTLGGIDTKALTKDATLLPKVITAVRNKIWLELGSKAADQYSEEHYALMKKAIVDMPYFIGQDEILGPLGVKLRDIGIHIRIGKDQIEIDQSEAYKDALEASGEGTYSAEEAETASELIYSMDILEMPTMNSVLPALKIALRKLRKVKKNYKWSNKTADDLVYNRQNIYETTAIGSFRPSSAEDILSKLFKVTKGVQSMDEMAMKLQNSLTTTPELIPLYEVLMEEKPVYVPNLGDYDRLAVALFTLAKADYDMINIAEKDATTLLVTDANNAKVKSKLKDAWSETIDDVQQSPVKSLDKKREVLRKYLSTVQALPVKRNKKGEIIPRKRKTEPNKNIEGLNNFENTHLEEAARQFELAGLTKIGKSDIKAIIDLVHSNPRRFSDSTAKKSPSEIIKTMLAKIVRDQIYTGNDVFAKDTDAFGENKYLNILADAVAESRTDMHVGAHLSGRGTIVHAFNMSTEAQDMWRRLQEVQEAQDDYGSDPMYAKSILYNVLTEDGPHKVNFRVQSLDTLTNNQKAKSGRTYGQLSTYDALTSRMQFFFRPNTMQGYFNAMSPTQGDNGNLTVIAVPKLNYKKGTSTQKVVVDGKIAPADISGWIKDQIAGELARIIESPNLEGFKNYSKTNKSPGNASKFNLFQSLNAVDINAANLSESNIEATVTKLYPTAEKEFIKMLESDAKYYTDKGVFVKNDNNSFKSKDKYLNNLTSAEMDTFLANNFIYGYEQQLFYAGDPAFYKEGTTLEQKNNINKRFRLPFTPGVKFAINSTMRESGDLETDMNNEIIHNTKMFHSGVDKTFKLKILKEANIKAELRKVYNVLGDGFMNAEGIDLADGQGFVSVNRYLQSMAARGIHTDELVEMVDQLNEWAKDNTKEITSDATLEVLKHFFFKVQKVSAQHNAMAPLSLKYAVFPAIPTLFERKNSNGDEAFPGLAKISRELRSGRADEVVMESAVKVGIRNVTDIKNLDTAQHITLDNDGMRVPQVTPVTKKTAARFGSQIRKLIMANHNPNADILGETGTVALDNYNKAISNVVSSIGEGVISQYKDMNGNVNMERVINTILRELEYNPFKNAEYYQAALRTLNEEGDSLLPANYPTIKSAIDSSIAAEFRKKVSKMKLPGYSAVQVSSMGTMYTEEGISVNSDLKFVGIKKGAVELTGDASLAAAEDIARGETKNYTIKPAEVRVSSQYFTNRLREISKERTKAGMKNINARVEIFRKTLNKRLSPAAIKVELTDHRNKLIQESNDKNYAQLFRQVSENGEISIAKVKEAGLADIVLYRIPTQGKNSMLAATIKDFLPPEAGASIQVPGEIVEQSGSDFDIDKVYIEMHKFGVDKGVFKKQSYRSSGARVGSELALADVILPIGISGSGKSTWIKSINKNNKFVVISPDEMRVKFTGDMNDKSKDKEIYEEATKRAIQAVKNNKQVIFDTTNLTKDKRRPFIEAIKKVLPDANIQYKLMDLNPELAKQRIKDDTNKYNQAKKEADLRPNNTLIPQNLQSGIEKYGTIQEANQKVKNVLGKNPYSIDMIDSKFRTRTTRTDSELKKYDLREGSYTYMFGKSIDGTTKKILVKITKITKGLNENTWYKEGWTQEGIKKLGRYNTLNAVEFEKVVDRANVLDSTIDRHAESYKQMLEDIIDEDISNYNATVGQSKIEIFKGFWNRRQVASQEDKVFLFGDNTNDRTVTKHVPSMTQAVIRGLSNAIGIDTKKDRGTSASSYLTDNDLKWFKNHVDTQIQLAKSSGKTIVMPADGIGTGKAMLKEKAPKLFQYLQNKLNSLEKGNIETLAEEIDYNTELATINRSQAYIMEYHKAVLSSPAYVSELLLPNRTTSLTRAVTELYPPNTDGDTSGMLSSVQSQEDFRNNNMQGGDMIGISSIASISHAVAKHIGTAFVKPIRIKGVNENAEEVALGETWNLVKGKYRARISDEIAEIQNAALDNANDPLLGKLNINQYTASAALLLISAGHGIEFATTFLNAPVIKELAALYPKLERMHYPTKAHEVALRTIARKYGLKLNTEEGFEKLPNFGMNDAKRIMNSTTPNDMTLSLEVFNELYTNGSALSKAQTLLNIDSSGTPTTTAGIIAKYENLASIEGTSSWVLEHSDFETGTTKLLPLLRGKKDYEAHAIKIDHAKYINTHLATMETYLLNRPLQILKETSPTATQQYQKVIRNATETLGYLDEFQAVKVLAAYDTFVATNDKSIINNTSEVSRAMAKDYTSMIDSTNPDSTANILKAYREKINKSNTEVENGFTENLTIVTEGSRKFVTFRNTVARAITPTKAKSMIAYYEDLMDSNSDIEKKLAKSLADYAIMFYGYSRSINSYMDFLPPRAHHDFMGGKKADANNVSLPDFFRDLQKTTNDESSYSTDSIGAFMHMYLANNVSTLPIDIYDVSLTQTNKPPLYAKSFIDKRWRLLYFDGQGYARQDDRGIPNLAVEYHSKDSLFNVPYASILAKAKRDSASKVNKNVMNNVGNEHSNFKDVTKTQTVRSYIKELISEDEFTIDNDADAKAYLEVLVERLEKNKESASDIEFIQDIYAGAIQNATFAHRKSAEKNNFEAEYKEFFSKYVADRYTQFLEHSDMELVSKLKKC